MSIVYKVEKLETCLEEMKPLLEDHYSEVAMYTDKVKLNPDYDKYQLLEDLDKLVIITVRDKDILVGYYISVIDYNPHYKDTLFSVNDIVFLKQDYRKAGVGIQLLQEVEKCMKDLGVKVMTIHTKVKIPFDSLCIKQEWDLAERLYTKYIGD